MPRPPRGDGQHSGAGLAPGPIGHRDGLVGWLVGVGSDVGLFVALAVAVAVGDVARTVDVGLEVNVGPAVPNELLGMGEVGVAAGTVETAPTAG